MIIGIDGNEANVENRVGISEYAFELLWQFKKNQKINIAYQIYLKDNPLSHMPSETENWKYRIVKPKRFWTQIGLPLDLYFHKPKPSVFFTPTHYGPRFSVVPSVISVMDLSFLHFPELFKTKDLYQLRSWTAYSVLQAKRILTISNASRDDIIKYYKVDPKKVVVIYLGIKNLLNSKKAQSMDEIKRKYGIKGGYILFVGTLQPRKNIARLVEAFSKLKENDMNLVIVGKKGWMYEEILQSPKKFDVESQTKFLEFVPDDDLQVLYKNATCFVLPSLYEGFGLPVLEAMAQGCPVIISNVSSLPEVGGNAALYIDLNDANDIAAKIMQLINDKALRKNLIEKGYKQAKKFSWEKTANETLRVLEEVAST